MSELHSKDTVNRTAVLTVWQLSLEASTGEGNDRPIFKQFHLAFNQSTELAPNKINYRNFEKSEICSCYL